jgi:hypothetical protein
MVCNSPFNFYFGSVILHKNIGIQKFDLRAHFKKGIKANAQKFWAHAKPQRRQGFLKFY